MTRTSTVKLRYINKSNSDNDKSDNIIHCGGVGRHNVINCIPKNEGQCLTQGRGTNVILSFPLASTFSVPFYLLVPVLGDKSNGQGMILVPRTDETTRCNNKSSLGSWTTTQSALVRGFRRRCIVFSPLNASIILQSMTNLYQIGKGPR